MTSTDTSASGIHVVEGLSRGQPIPVDGDSVTAFVGPAPRGPVDRAIKIASADEFTRIFDAAGSTCRLGRILRDFFAAGGTNAVVVRISGTSERARMYLPGPAGELILEARNPGAAEYLRAAIDYDGIDPEGHQQFNLVLQRLRGPDSAWIDNQECFRRVTVEPTSRDYIGYVLNQSELAMLAEDAPQARPHATYATGTLREPVYVNAILDGIAQPPPTDYDILGSEQAGTGLNALEHVEDLGQVCLLGGTDAGLGPVALLAADKFCRRHQSFLLLEPPARWDSVSAIVRDQAFRAFSSPNAMTWFPNLSLRGSTGKSERLSALGSMAAALAARCRPGISLLGDSISVPGIRGARPVTELEPADLHKLKRLGINALTQRSPLHFRLEHGVTMVRNEVVSANWQSLDLRCHTLMILRRIRQATRWTFFQRSDQNLWDELSAQITDYLTELHARSMLAGQHAAQAFFVKCDRETNREQENKTGEVSLIVGFALKQPGQFLSFRIQRAEGACRIVELGWESALELAV